VPATGGNWVIAVVSETGEALFPTVAVTGITIFIAGMVTVTMGLEVLD
jgi:hypothetical protein